MKVCLSCVGLSLALRVGSPSSTSSSVTAPMVAMVAMAPVTMVAVGTAIASMAARI